MSNIVFHSETNQIDKAQLESAHQRLIQGSQVYATLINGIENNQNGTKVVVRVVNGASSKHKGQGVHEAYDSQHPEAYAKTQFVEEQAPAESYVEVIITAQMLQTAT